jgi:hypothetical protein
MEVLIFTAIAACIAFAKSALDGANSNHDSAFSGNSFAGNEGASSRDRWLFDDDDNSGVGMGIDHSSSSSMFDDSMRFSSDEHVNIWTDPSYFWMDGNLFHTDTSISSFDDHSYSSFDSFSSSSSSMSDW